MENASLRVARARGGRSPAGELLHHQAGAAASDVSDDRGPAMDLGDQP
jgi:hypothetical protein